MTLSITKKPNSKSYSQAKIKKSNKRNAKPPKTSKNYKISKNYPPPSPPKAKSKKPKTINPKSQSYAKYTKRSQ
jgi:hypothetical protein